MRQKHYTVAKMRDVIWPLTLCILIIIDIKRHRLANRFESRYFIITYAKVKAVGTDDFGHWQRPLSGQPAFTTL